MRKNHRRIKRDRLQTIYVRNRTVTKDSEGVPTESFGTAYSLKAEVWSAGDKRQIEQYGDRIANIANVRVQGKYDVALQATHMKATFADGNTIEAGDGICIFAGDTDSPDYTVLTITPSRPMRLEVERRLSATSHPTGTTGVTGTTGTTGATGATGTTGATGNG